MATLSGGRGWLSDEAAASIHRMDAAYGGRIPINSAGRTYAEQAEAYRKYQNGGPLALRPGTSIHETGNAVDFRNDAWGWLGSGRGLGWNGARANEYGWRRTVSSEQWHYEYDASRDRYRGQGAANQYAASVTDIQNLANKLGANLAVDGIYGAATTGWVRAFQGDWGLGVDGIVGPQTWAKMNEVANGGGGDWPARARYGENWVRAIQEKLNRLGYSVGVDGKDGPATQSAVKDFQSKQGLTADGIAGPDTNNRMDAVLTSGPASNALAVDGEWGAGTTRKLQSVLGVTVDGQLGPDTLRALQGRLGVAQDGQLGPDTTRALQRAVGSTPDGEMGPNTVSALQRYLNAGGTFQDQTPAPTPTPAPAALTVDGDWGPATTRALQTKLGVTADGELGPQTWKALQSKLGVTADGQPGPQTYRALQALLGVVVDGALGPETVKALQNFLNSNGEFKAVTVPPPADVIKYGKPEKPTYPKAAEWYHSSNSSPRRTTDKIDRFVIHHAASTSSKNSLRDRFLSTNDRNVSPNWQVNADGSLFEIVPPDNFRAWTSGQFDYRAVTIETQNTSGDPNWGISNESKETIAQLVAWASKRYGFPIDSEHVIGHKDVPGASTACPGPSMNVPLIIQRAKVIAADSEAEVKPTPTPEVPPVETPSPNPVPQPEPTPDIPGKEDPTTGEWIITLPKDEAIQLGLLFDQVRKLLP